MILYLLLDEASYGYEISKRISSLTQENYNIKETTLYSAFTRLERNGFISSFAGDEPNQRRTYYKITGAGINFYKEKCQEWQLTKRVVEKFIEEDINEYH
jgi:PadR family transcriptional regulator PadR